MRLGDHPFAITENNSILKLAAVASSATQTKRGVSLAVTEKAK